MPHVIGQMEVFLQATCHATLQQRAFIVHAATLRSLYCDPMAGYCLDDGCSTKGYSMGDSSTMNRGDCADPNRNSDDCASECRKGKLIRVFISLGETLFPSN